MADRAENQETKIPWLGRLFQPSVAAAVIALAVFFALYSQFLGSSIVWSSPKVPQIFQTYSEVWGSLQAGLEPYSDRGYSSFTFSPAFLALLNFLPRSAQDAWFVLSLISIAFFSIVLFTGARYRDWIEIAYLLAGLGLSWRGILECLQHGQMELLIFSLIVTATSLFSRVPFITGVILGLLPWMRIYYVFLFVPFFLAASRRDPSGEPRAPQPRLKLLFSGLLFSSVFWGAAVPSMVFGPDQALSYSISWYKLIQSQPALYFFSGTNQSLWVAIERWFELDQSFVGYGIAAILLGTLLGLLVLRRPVAPSAQDSFVWLTPWLIMNQLLNPLSWRWGSVALIGTCFSAFRPGRRWFLFRGLLWIAVVFLFLLQQNFFVRPFLGLETWTTLHEFGTVTLLWLMLLVLSL